MILKMRIGLNIGGKQRAVGDTIEVSDSVAKRWAAAGIAENVAPDPEPTGGDDLSTPDTPQSKKPTSTSEKK